MPNKANVSTGKPKVAGAVFRAAAGSTLPTDPTTALDTAFADLGYISEDGVTNNNSPETENIKAWGGQVVLVVSTEKPDEFQLTFIEALNENVLKTVYGDANVTTGQNGVVTVKATADEPGEHAYVIDMILKAALCAGSLFRRASSKRPPKSFTRTTRPSAIRSPSPVCRTPPA